jgi:hypothetical protein
LLFGHRFSRSCLPVLMSTVPSRGGGAF